MNYKIKKEKSRKKLINNDCNIEGYKFSPMNKITKELEIKSITILDPQMIENILLSKFNKKFKNILQLAYLAMNDEDESNWGAIDIVLDEMAKFKSLIKNKYQKFISKEKAKEMLNKLKIIEKELELKQLEINAKYEKLSHERSR